MNTHVQLTPITATGVVVLAMIGYGFNPLFARWIYAEGLSPEISVFYRYGLPALLMAPFLKTTLRFPRESLLSFIGGLAMGVGALGYFKALAVLPVSLCILIFFTYPLFTIMVSSLVFRIPLTRRNFSASILILLGCAFTLTPSGDFSTDQWIAVLWCFLAPLGVTTIILIFSLKIRNMRKLSSTSLLLCGNTLVGTVALYFQDGERWLPLTTEGYFAIIGVGLITALLPHLLFIWASPTAGPARTAIAGSAEFLTSLTIGWVILAEPVLWNQMLAAVAILTALLISVTSKINETGLLLKIRPDAH